MLNFSKNKLYNLTIILTIIIAVVLRTETYLSGRPLWSDETALACNILTRHIYGFFTHLDYVQKAPPFFMMAVKLVTDIFGVEEWQLRLIPFLSSIGSIFIFFFLSKKILLKKSSIIIANILFAINYYLIRYAQEFKQYSSEVFLVLVSLFLFEKIELEQLTYKKIFFYSLLSIILILFSFPMLFVILAFITLNLIKVNKESIKKLVFYTFPIGIACFCYYYFAILPTRDFDIAYFNEYWKNGFLNPNIISFLSLLKTNLTYYFNPNKITLIAFLPMIIGIYAIIQERKKIHHFCFYIVIFAILASLFHFYPIEKRTALYLFPIVLLLIVKPIDLFSKKTKLLTVIVICSFLMCFTQYNFNYIKSFFDKNTFAIQDARTTMQIIIENYKPSDIFVYNKASETDFIYYRKYFNFNPTKHIFLNPTKYDKKEYLKILDSLPKNQTYWFYFSFDYEGHPVIGFVKEWLQINRIKYNEFHYKRSHVWHIKL